MTRWRLLPCVLLLLGGSVAAHAQGCSQCRETVGQTPARTQQAYRRGIEVMVVSGAAVFAGGVAAMRRFR